MGVIDFYQHFLFAGEKIPVICVTTKFSGSMQSAPAKKNIVPETYKNAKITQL